MSQTLHTVFERFSQQRVLVVGDVMIDAYLWGKVERISPEAPVPVIDITRKEDRLGGAANVALNLQALGAEPLICAVVGDDARSADLCRLLREQGMSDEGLVHSPSRITTVKTRIISQDQHILRVDEEQTTDIRPEEEQQLLQRITDLIDSGSVQVVIFEDYNKGVLTENLIASVIAAAQRHAIPTCVDPKKKNFFAYRGVTLFKPNLKELREGLKTEIDKSDPESLRNAVEELHRRLPHRISLITLSERGVYLHGDGADVVLPAHPRSIIDVSGAGDTVIAVAALCLALQLPPEQLAALSNLAGGLVCEKVGVVPIDKARLLEEAEKL